MEHFNFNWYKNDKYSHNVRNTAITAKDIQAAVSAFKNTFGNIKKKNTIISIINTDTGEDIDLTTIF